MSLLFPHGPTLCMQSSRAIIGFVQHSVLALYYLASAHVLLTKAQFCQYVGAFPYSGHQLPLPCVQDFYSGRQLLSIFLPPGFSAQLDGGKIRIQVRFHPLPYGP